jgi:hypothetical protein
MMFWLDLVLTMSLPLVAVGVLGVVLSVVMRYTAFKPEAFGSSRQTNRAPEGAPQLHRHGTHGASGWESSLDAEIQRLKRKSMGL